MPNTHKHSRRLFLSRAARLAVAGAVLPLAKPALASLPGARELEFDHTHTGERVSVVFAVGHHYIPEALTTLNRFLRDHYSGEVGHIDPQLFDLLFKTRQELGCDRPSRLSPATAARRPIRTCATVAAAVSPATACTCWAKPSTSAFPASRFPTCATLPNRWAPAELASIRATASSTSIPARSATGSWARLEQAMRRGLRPPFFLVPICLMIVNLPVHLRVHNLPLISFGFFPDA